MFRHRIITAIILLGLVLICINIVNYIWMNVIVGLLVLWCAIEWLQLVPIINWWDQLVFLLTIALCVICNHYFFMVGLGLGIIFFVCIAICILNYPKYQFFWNKKHEIIVFSCITLPLFFNSLINIYLLDFGKLWLLYLLSLVWAADIGGYIFGKLFGKHKLIPLISPGKTFEGFIGGNILVIIISLIALRYFNNKHLIGWLLMAELMYIVAVIGDLFISMLKRRVNIKDTGTLLPGHGGILDRLDSLIFTSPIFYLFCYYFSNL